MPARVLMVEDDADARMVLRGHLEPLYAVLEAADGEAGWRRFEAERPDLVLTDLGMPGLNGLDLTARIKAHAELGGTPVIILTGAVTGEELPGGFWKMGTEADAFLEKPVDGATLRAEVDRLIKKRAGWRELPPGKGEYG